MPHIFRKFVLRGKPKTEKIEFTDDLRERVYQMAGEMHELWNKGYTPKVKPQKGCKACSLKDLCLPKLSKVRSVTEYIEERMGKE